MVVRLTASLTWKWGNEELVEEVHTTERWWQRRLSHTWPAQATCIILADISWRPGHVITPLSFPPSDPLCPKYRHTDGRHVMSGTQAHLGEEEKVFNVGEWWTKRGSEMAYVRLEFFFIV